MATVERRATLLIAEDDPDQREILAEVFGYEGYRVLTAASPPQTAERLGQDEDVDVLLLDVHGAFGPEVEAALRALGDRRPAVVVVSGDVRAPIFMAPLEADHFVEKPYDLADLLALVAGLAARRPPKLQLIGGGLAAAG